MEKKFIIPEVMEKYKYEFTSFFRLVESIDIK